VQDLEPIIERIQETFESRTRMRDQALAQARILTRHAAHAIRAIHRSEHELAHEHLQEAKTLAAALKADLAGFPDLYYAGYTQDALKEYCEATITVALVENQSLPDPESLGQEYATYLNGLAETTGELRRRCLDILRQGYSREAERLLSCMDDIYAVLVTLDYPDAITNGLRRQTDLVRGIVERTRGDLTISLREQQLEQALERISAQMHASQETDANDPGL
jgi:translin